MTAFRAVTYNVHKCRGLDGRVSPLRIAEVLADIDADIIALQEVLENQAACIAEHLGFAYALGENRRLAGFGYGNVILTRLPIRLSRNYDLSVHGREERGCLRADIALGDGVMLHVFAVHLGTAFFERRNQGRLLIAPELLSDPALTEPRIVLGDFNEWTRGLATRLLCAHLVSADVRKHLLLARTYPGVIPVLHLDHIYYDRALGLERLAVHRTPKALIASDHLPLYGDFRWDKKENGSK